MPDMQFFGKNIMKKGTVFTPEAFQYNTDFLFSEIMAPGGTGLDLQTQLNTRDYTMPIIFITGAEDTTSVVQAMKLGAVDFLAKPVDNEKMIRIITDAVESDIQARAQYAQLVAAKKKITRLTAREREVLELVVKGLQNKQIAHRLGISIKTVKAHRGHVMHKVEANSVTDLVRLSEIAVEAPIPT